MNLKYLTEKIIPQRNLEIDSGENLSTAKPIYVVMNSIETIVSGHSEFSPSTDMKDSSMDHGYIDLGVDAESRKFQDTDEDMLWPEKVTRFFVDRPVAFFLTKKAAREYISYQAHNLTNPYLYVFSAGYRNHEMNNLLNNER